MSTTTHSLGGLFSKPDLRDYVAHTSVAEFPPSFNIENRGTTKTLTRSGNSQSILSQLHDFCNYYADEFAASDTPYLRSIAEDLRNLPYDVAKDGLIAGIAKLTGKKYLPYITDLLEKIGDIGRENNIFGDCYVSLSGVNGSNGNYSINCISILITKE